MLVEPVSGRAFQGRQKHGCFCAAYMDVFTAALESPPRDRLTPSQNVVFDSTIHLRLRRSVFECGAFAIVGSHELLEFRRAQQQLIDRSVIH